MAGADVGHLILAFILAVAAMGLVLTALTHVGLRRPPNAPAKRSNVPTGLHLVLWLLITSMAILLLIGIAGWVADIFAGTLPAEHANTVAVAASEEPVAVVLDPKTQRPPSGTLRDGVGRQGAI